MDKKEAYEKKFNAQLDELNAKIEVLEDNAKLAGASVEADYYRTIEELKKKRSEAQDKLKKLREAGDDAWENMKQDVEESWTSFTDAVESAFSRLQ